MPADCIANSPSFSTLLLRETGLFFYYNTKTHESSWEKPERLEDEEILTPRDRARLKIKVEKRLDGREKTAYNMTEDDAALSIQGLFRTVKAKAELMNLCTQVYEKIYDPDSEEYFYYNKNTDESTWFKPLILGWHDIEESKGRDDVYLLASRIPAFENILKRNQREFVAFLEENELAYLYETLMEEGFDDLEALCAMQPEDFELMGLKSNQRGKSFDPYATISSSFSLGPMLPRKAPRSDQNCSRAKRNNFKEG